MVDNRYPTPPSAVNSQAANSSPFRAIVLDKNDEGPDIVRKAMERDAAARGDADYLARSGRTWTDLKGEISSAEGNASLSQVGRAERLKPAFERAASEVVEMLDYADQLDANAVELERKVDDEDGHDIAIDEAERQTLLSELPRMDRRWLGQRYMQICSKPKAQWTRAEGNVAWAVTRLHRSLGLEVIDPVLFNAGLDGLVAQSKHGPAVKQSRERASMVRGMANEIKQAAGKAAAKHGVAEDWERALGLEPVDPETRAKWPRRR